MKISALNVDFNRVSFDPVGLRSPPYEGIASNLGTGSMTDGRTDGQNRIIKQQNRQQSHSLSAQCVLIK